MMMSCGYDLQTSHCEVMVDVHVCMDHGLFVHFKKMCTHLRVMAADWKPSHHLCQPHWLLPMHTCHYLYSPTSSQHLSTWWVCPVSPAPRVHLSLSLPVSIPSLLIPWQHHARQTSPTSCLASSTKWKPHQGPLCLPCPNWRRSESLEVSPAVSSDFPSPQPACLLLTPPTAPGCLSQQHITPSEPACRETAGKMEMTAKLFSLNLVSELGNCNVSVYLLMCVTL